MGGKKRKESGMVVHAYPSTLDAEARDPVYVVSWTTPKEF